MADDLTTYDQAIEYLYGRINYERAHVDTYSSSDFRLDRMRGLLDRIGNPQERIPAVHVAGTKGKGSTCAMIAAVTRAAGIRTGLYTSPHLTRYEERFTVDGQLPAPAVVVELVNALRPAVAEMDRLPAKLNPTYFEITTAIAWLLFVREGVQLAVLETGLGGRLDSTSVCEPWVTVITNVSRDHTQLLGSTVSAIATEKAGIIKPGIPVIAGVQHPEAIAVVQTVSAVKQAPLWLLGRDFSYTLEDQTRVSVRCDHDEFVGLPLILRGPHQALNTSLAVAALLRLRERGLVLSEAAIRTGLATVVWPGRIEVVGTGPEVVLDAAHNWESAKALVETLLTQFPARRRVLVFATTRDKDSRGLVRMLLPHFETVVLTRYTDNPRSVPAEELAAFIGATSDRRVHVATTPAAAWECARRLAGSDDQIVITGSFFLIAELRDRVLAEMSNDKPLPVP